MLSLETHQNFNIGVKALIVHDERVLLLHRADHNVWEPPGGRINSGENIEETLLRELVEELPGITNCIVKEIVHADSPDFALPNGNRLMLLFFRVNALLPDALVVKDEHSELTWALAEQLDSLPMQLPTRAAAVRALLPFGRLGS
jgi:8-oxo-dGTP diphosphatase